MTSIWIVRDYENCTGCRRCELACSLHHEGWLRARGPDVTWTPIVDDENPPRFYEPLPSGPWKGRTTDRELVKRKRLTYFETLGWDERGIPKTETLKRLGLEDLEPSMKGLRE